LLNPSFLNQTLKKHHLNTLISHISILNLRIYNSIIYGKVSTMVSFNDIKEKLWLIAIVAGILGLVTIFTPVWGIVSGSNYAVGWLWPLYIESGEPSIIPLDEPLASLGLVATLIIAVGTCLLLVGGILTKKKDREINLLYLIGGVLLLTGIITFMAGTAAFYPYFWIGYSVHISAILAYIGGGLGLAAGIIGIMENRK
jgi:hypothetical protein